jgi:hypothetical protein
MEERQGEQGGARSRLRRLPRYQQMGTGRVGSLVLTDRDRAVLDNLYHYRLLSTSQLELLRQHDPDSDCQFHSRRALNTRLQRLFHHRYVNRVQRPLDKGSLEPIYLLDVNGAKAMAAVYGEVSYKTPAQLPKGEFIEHTLAINTFRVALDVALRSQDEFVLETWQYAPKLSVPSAQPPERSPKLLIPDAAVTLRREDRRRYFYLEMDLGTEPSRTLREKCETYYSYWRSGAFGKEHGEPADKGFRVLFVGQSPAREETMQKVIVGLPHGRAMFLTAVMADVTYECILQAIWWNESNGSRLGLIQ